MLTAHKLTAAITKFSTTSHIHFNLNIHLHTNYECEAQKNLLKLNLYITELTKTQAFKGSIGRNARHICLIR